MKKHLEAFKHAFRGGCTLVKSQPHFRFHLMAAGLVILLGFLCRITAFEWTLIVMATTLVWATEALNTALEFLADEVTLERREGIRNAKDAAAFSVLAASTGAALIGLLIFVPYVV